MYKKSILLVLLLAFAAALQAQSPQAINYQAVVRTASGDIIPNQNVSFRIGILQGSPSGTSVYSESHNATSNGYGLVNLQVGNGTLISGNFGSIDWGNGPFYFKVELDAAGGSNYTLMGTSQLLSVPYALYAENAGGSIGDEDQDSTNELQTLSITGDSLHISDGNTVFIQDDVDDADSDPSNELQVLSLSNDTLYLSNGGSVYIGSGSPVYQLLSLNADTLSISNGNSVVLDFSDDDADSTNELQNLSLTGDTLSISDGNYVLLTAGDEDADSTNELQNLSLVGDTLRISDGNYVNLYDHPLIMTGTQPTDRQIKMVGDPSDSTDAVNAQSLQWSSVIYAEATGATDTFIVNLTPAITTLRPGTQVLFKANHDVNGSAALELNGLGPIPIKKHVNMDLYPGEILSGQMVQLFYDGTVFQIGNSVWHPGAGSGGGSGDDGPCYTCDGY